MKRHPLFSGAALVGLGVLASGGACTATSHQTSDESTRGNKAAVTDCNGLYGTTPAPDGEYDGTSFGCWVDASGNGHSDQGDNCIPSCIAQAQQADCAGLDGPSCEKQINWYSADAARFGCLARIQVTNEANGKAVVLMALDNGPNCKLERAIDKPLLDMSGAATEYLFGGEVGYKDGASVHVDVVDPSTPLGPVTNGGTTSTGSTSTGSTSGGSSGQGGDTGSSSGQGGNAPSGSSSSSSGGTSSGAPSDAMDRAKSAMGFSYWWGHGAWLASGPGSDGGTCDGSCPNCTHDGSYGADCSGFVAKVWQVPSDNNDITVDSHPYSTADFNQDTSEWSTVDQGSMVQGDALVYNDGTHGHIALYGSGDAWGSPYVYECKGCAYGCVEGVRSISSAYHGIRRSGW